MHVWGDIVSAVREYGRMFKDPWRKWNRGQGIRVAVIDSGINRALISHTLQQRIVLAHDLLSPSGADGRGYKDRHAYFHGTACASLVASTAKHCALVDCRVADSQWVDPSVLASAILWAATEGKAHVISISVGTKKLDQIDRMRKACQSAQTNGSVVIAACPNVPSLSLPSSLQEVISVDSMDLGRCGRWCCSSSVPNRIYCHGGPYRPKHYRNSDEMVIRGNSAAAAVVSGQIARLLSSFQVNSGEVYDLMCRYGAAVV